MPLIVFFSLPGRGWVDDFLVEQHIEVVFDKLFQYLYIQRKLKKKKLLNGKTFQINLERNDNKSESILCGNVNS